MKVGLLGTALQNDNLGVVALTYSLVELLHEINPRFELYNFSKSNFQNVKLLEKELSIDTNFSYLSEEGSGFIKRKNLVKTFYNNYSLKQKLAIPEIFIDITEGDSFSDIYGSLRFDSWTKVKEYIIANQKKLILGPQTYGPFNNLNNKKRAKEIIEASSLVITRDMMSKEYVEAFANKKIELSTDLAFRLPYSPLEISSDKVKVGLNVSGLLWGDGYEITTKKFSLSLDYKKLIVSLIQWLTKNNYEVHLIPHVMISDMKAIEELHTLYPQTVVASYFKSPVEAKGYIAAMDIFIGARMHATIAAFSSNVATIPMAYSRKFEGLFKSLGYDINVSLTDLSFDLAMEKIKNYIENYEQITCDVKEIRPVIEEKNQYLLKLFKGFLMY